MSQKNNDFIHVDSEVLVYDEVKIEEPKLYEVALHNDDYTTQEFVIHVLTKFFHKTPKDAFDIMMKVHTKGQAVVGVYSKDIAETKTSVVISYARENGMPLMVSYKPQS